ncbi:MAG: ABC transporter ATP-binding protein [Paludibacteraceae bacterium]|nr:ABC transporter ATP-binding protein [Paludibacteraceae bacterium]
MNLFKLLRRFVPPYKWQVLGNIFFHLLSTLLSIFSFASIVPILQILFGISEAHMAYTDWDWSMSVSDIFSAMKNNVFWWLEQQISISGAHHVLLLLGVGLIVLTFLKTAASYMGSFFMIPIRTGVLRDLRSQLYNKIISLPIGFFTEERKGDVISRMTSDVAEVENSIMSSLDMIVKNPIMIIMYLCTMFFMSWQLTLFVLLLLPVSGWIIGLIGRSLKRKSQRGQEQTADLISQVEETLGGLRVVKAFNAEHKLRDRFSRLNNETRKTFNRVNRRYQLAHPVSEFLGTSVIAVLLWYGGGLILSDTSPIGPAEFIYYLVIFYSIINPFKELSKASYSIRKGMASLERIDKILLAENVIKDPATPEPLNTFSTDIRYENISFSYDTDREVIHNVTLHINKGQTVALVGQSGGGKTTMLDLLPRFYDVTSGAILVDGHDLRTLRVRDLRALMGVVNQEPILFNDTFFNNIAFGVEHATQEQVEEAARIANAHEFIMQTPDGYQTTIGERGAKLSGGQRQRISIARAILKNPPILILDEATSALDTEAERLVQDALEKLMTNRTTLVVAHRLSTIRRADLICVMHEGRIVEQGCHEQLLALDGYYKKLWHMQK